MTDWQEAYFDLVNKVECECVQQGDLVPIWDQFKRMNMTITKLQGNQAALEAELAKFKALAETLAGALEAGTRFMPPSATVWHREAAKALREYKEARDER